MLTPRATLPLALFAAACGGHIADGGDVHDDGVLENALSPGATVRDAITAACTTATVLPLARQLVDQINCLRPNFLKSIAVDNVDLGGAVLPYLQAPAADALARTADRVPLTINSALRTLPQQYLLYEWMNRRICRDVVSLAAPPGTSNHEAGLAVDVDNYGQARGSLEARGFRWYGSGDVVHFDYVSGGEDTRSLSVRAFQTLWNANHPEARVAEDGDFGGETEAVLLRAPANGFSKGATCGGTTATPPATDLAPIEVYWARQADGSYALRALAPPSVTQVEYAVDNYVIGAATRNDGPNFPDSYRFTTEGTNRLFEVRGLDAAGKQVGLGVGAIDVTAGAAVSIRQMGRAMYEISVERAPAGVAAIEVRADGYLLTDTVGGKARSTRLAVRSTFTQLGPRRFRVTTFNSDGTTRGSLDRTLTLR